MTPKPAPGTAKFAEQGHAPAQFCLGVMHDQGRGVTQDDAEADIWLRKAAEQGHINAQFSIGTRYANVPSASSWTKIETVAWFRQDAEQGYIDAKGQPRCCSTPSPSRRATGLRRSSRLVE